MNLKVNLLSTSYEIKIGINLLGRLKDFVNLNRKVMIITDSLIPKMYYEQVVSQCKNGFIYIVDSGESSKNFNNYHLIIDLLLELNFSRSDLVIALGGGVIGDLAGFVASTFKRGIDFVSIPTSTLAMIDSSVGGKNGVNFKEYKNMIGTFYHPSYVLIDLNVLHTLPKRHFYNGLVEALKAGLIGDYRLFRLFELDNIQDKLEEIIVAALKFKIKVIEEDEKEANLRKILNFGHTIGHAIESSQHFKGLYHGEAVAIGMLYMINNPSLLDKVKNIINNKLMINTDIKINDDLIKFITNDKKSSNNRIDIITIDEIAKYHIKNIAFYELEKIIKKGEAI